MEFPIILMAVGVVFLFTSFVTVAQGTIAIVTVFGKYRRLLYPGLNFKIPFIETVFSRVSVQNQSAELDFQAITQDQANVHFKAMLLYSVVAQDEETIKNVAFKFINRQSFMTALVRTIEGSVRAFVATKKQAEILGLRRDIVNEVKENLDQTLEQWGYHLIDLQLNDIGFDEVILRSMAQVVASNNLKAAAENEGQALLITKTRGAEADGNAIRIAAEAERTAAQLRGQGVALFRGEVAKGITEAAREMSHANLDASLILFSMWTEMMKHMAETGKGNVLFMDGSTDAMQRTFHEMMGLQQMKNTGLEMKK